MNSQQLCFVKPRQVEIREQALPGLAPDQVLLKTLYSGISAGTEMLVYRGQLPQDVALDENLAAFKDQSVKYPLTYGYACISRIEEVGDRVDGDRLGKTVFSFHPHGSHHVCTMDEVIPLPDGIEPKDGVFLANMETAVNLAQDGNPRLGERVVVLGQGIVGLLLSAVLAGFPLAGLYALDRLDNRRTLARQAGAGGGFDPDSDSDLNALREALQSDQPRGGADVVFELSGSPAALNLAVEICAYTGRIVVGSWYGTKQAELNLGARFHRNRLTMVSSQVSTIAPELSGRWDKTRRFQVAWELIRKIRPSRYISHCMPLARAAEAYRLVDDSAGEALQVVFEYPD